jgi:Flp pilus assembly protein TadG
MKKKRNRGQVLVLVALAIIVLLGFSALAIDLGYLYTVRHELQRCADAGALAGASVFKDDGKGSENNGTKNKAKNRAKDFATKDKVITSVLDPNTEVVVKFRDEDPTLTYFQVRVETSRTAGLIFGRIFRPTALVTAYAIAEAATASHNVNCIKPWGISYPWLDNNPMNGQYDGGETVYRDCDPNNPTWSFCPGTMIQIKVSTKDNNATPSPQTEPSHFFALDFAEMTRRMAECSGPGGAAGYEDWITTKCLDDCLTVSVGDSIPVEPGNMVGPTIDGAQSLINQESTELGGVTTFPSDCDHPVFFGETCDAGTKWKLSPRVFRIPVYDPVVDQLDPGNTDIHVAEFAGMWIDHVDPVGADGQGSVYGRWINADLLAGEGGGAPTGTPKLLYLRLVK